MGAWERERVGRMVDMGDRMKSRWSTTGVARGRGESVRGRRKHMAGGKGSCRSTRRRGHVPNVSFV